nr:immunoglobulin light chain junction region [Macaca mulatta]
DYYCQTWTTGSREF